jgi:hypothetical protein
MATTMDRTVLTIESTRRGVRSLFDSGKEGINKWRRDRNLASLERDLAKIIETANSHSAKGTPKGAAVYFTLRDRANTKINAFCNKWHVDRSIIEAEAPNLKELDALCLADKAANPAIKMMAMFLGGVLSLVVLGMASGVFTWGHNLIVNHLPH